MTTDEVKQLLNEYKQANSEYWLSEKLYKRKREALGLINAVDYSAVRVKSSNTESSVERAVESLDSYATRFENACKKLFDIEDKICDILETLDCTEKAIIVERYINCKPLYQVAREVGLSYSRVKHKPAEIIKKYVSKKSLIKQ